MIMTQDKARKIAIRQRMAETGEPYSVARHAVEDEYVSSAGPLESPADRSGGMTGDVGDAEALPPEQAWHLAEQARYLAEQARIRAERAGEAADRAEEAIDEAGHLADVYEDGPPRWHHHPSRPAHPPQAPQPPQAPRPPRPPRIHYDGPPGQDDWPPQHPDPVGRLQDRVDQFIHRLSSARDQAGRLISAAERIFTPAPPQPVHSEPASEPGPADSA